MGDVLRWPKQAIQRVLPTAIAGRFPCLFGHEWSVWSEPFQHRIRWVDDDTVTTQLRQKRYCKRCNRVDYRKCKTPSVP